MTYQLGLFADERSRDMNIPALEFGPIRCAIGRIYCHLKPGGLVQAEPAGECHISLRIKEPLFKLPSGERIVITTRRNVARPDGITGVLFREDSGTLTWQSHIEIEELQADAAIRGWPDVICDRAAKWERRFLFRAESPNEDGSVNPGNEGLRPPQLGALHAIGAHWSLYRHPATVVMPTGTGKTETMLATLAAFIRDPARPDGEQVPHLWLTPKAWRPCGRRAEPCRRRCYESAAFA